MHNSTYAAAVACCLRARIVQKRKWYHNHLYMRQSIVSSLNLATLRLDLVKVSLRPPDTRVVSEVRLDQMGELGIDVQRSRNLRRHARDLRLLLPRHALPELLLRGLTTECRA